MSRTNSAKQRDPLLDLWRGLALVDMAWVHLATYPIGIAALLAAWIGDYTRFAAGAFVFISGLSVARVFGPRLVGDAAEVQTTRRRLLRRALNLALLDRLVAVAFGLIERSLSVPPTVTPNYPDLVDLLTFREPGVTGGLLFLYAVFLAATPLLNGVLRRYGSLAVLAISVGLFALAHADGLGSDGAWPFPVAYWQVLFVMGYVVAQGIPALRDDAGQIVRWWLVLVSVVFAAVFLLRNGGSLGLAVTSALPGLAFVKVPLSPAELAWYLAVTALVLTWSAWIWERAAWIRHGLGWLVLLGRQSLLVYVGHLFIQLTLIEALTLLDPPTTGRVLMLPLMALMLVGVAAMGERWGRASTPLPSTQAPRRRLLPRPAILGGAVIAGTFGTVMTLQVVVGTPVSWQYGADAYARLQGEPTAEEGADIASLDEESPNPFQIPWLAVPEPDVYPGPGIFPEVDDPARLDSET